MKSNPSKNPMANDVGNLLRIVLPITARARCIIPVIKEATTRAIEAPSALYKLATVVMVSSKLRQ